MLESLNRPVASVDEEELGDGYQNSYNIGGAGPTLYPLLPVIYSNRWVAVPDGE